MPSPGGQISEMGPRAALGSAWWQRVRVISTTSRRATTRHPGRRPGRISSRLACNGAPGVSRGRALPGRGDDALGPALVEIQYGQQAAGRHHDARHAPAHAGTAHHDDQAT